MYWEVVEVVNFYYCVFVVYDDYYKLVKFCKKSGRK